MSEPIDPRDVQRLVEEIRYTSIHKSREEAHAEAVAELVKLCDLGDLHGLLEDVKTLRSQYNDSMGLIENALIERICARVAQ